MFLCLVFSCFVSSGSFVDACVGFCLLVLLLLVAFGCFRRHDPGVLVVLCILLDWESCWVEFWFDR